MVYKVLLGFAVAFIIIGLLLAVTTVFVFFKSNMAEVYDSLLGRNYSAKIRQKKNDVKVLHSSSIIDRPPQNQVTCPVQNNVRHSPNPGGQVYMPQQKNGTLGQNAAQMNPPQQSMHSVSYNSGNTALLNRQKPENAYRSGNTTVLNQKQDNTDVLGNQKNSPKSQKGFVVTDEISYTSSNEKIE